MAVEHDVVLGVDIGTSAVKVLACTLDGRVLSSASDFYPLQTPHPEWVEQDAEAIYTSVVQTVRKTLEDVALRGSSVRAVGFSAAMHGVLAVDANGDPISPLLTWMDRRSGSIAEGWRADGTGLDLYGRTGAPMHPMLPVCKLRWMSEKDAGVFRRAARFVSMKELIVARWTGEWVVDYGIAAATGMFDERRRAWDERALELARIEPQRLSSPVSTHSAYHDLRPAVASALGLPKEASIVLCSSDGALANIGVGAIGRGNVALTLGTSGAVRTLLDEPILDEQGRTFCYLADDDHYIVGGPTSSAGAVLNWFLALLLDEVDEPARFNRAVELAAQIEPGAQGLTMLPFLSGERAPYWMSELRGTIVGLDLAHDRRHILRAAFESVVFALYSVQELLSKRAGAPRRVLLSGGLTHAPLVRSMIADIFGTDALRPSQSEASGYGAAMMAAQAVGLLPSLEAIAKTITYPETIAPDIERRATYRELFARYEQAATAVLPLFTTP